MHPFFVITYVFDFRSWVELSSYQRGHRKSLDVRAHLVTEACTIPFFGSFSTMIRFLLSCSCTKITLSVPLTTKYPPGSNGHSLSFAISHSLLLDRTHLLLLSIMGNRPMFIPLFLMICFPRLYSTSTNIGAAYVRSRKRHSFGVISALLSISRRSGVPIRMSVYLHT